jgi:hypothetical protein
MAVAVEAEQVLLLYHYLEESEEVVPEEIIQVVFMG